MSDRTWNRIESRLYDEWQLSKHARLILAHVIALSPNQYGVYDPSPYGRLLEWWSSVITVEQFETAWASLISSGKIFEFRNRDCLWLIKKFKHEQFKDLNLNQRKGVANFLTNYPEVMESFMDLYSIPIETPSKPHSIPIETPSEGDSKGYAITDTDTDITNNTADSGESAARVAPVEEKKKRKAAPRIKTADLPSLKALEAQLPAECEPAWTTYKFMCAGKRTGNAVAETVLASDLVRILTAIKDEGLNHEQVSYGLLAAVKAKGGGADNPNYVLTAARNYYQDVRREGYSKEPETPSWVGKSRSEMTDEELEAAEAHRKQVELMQKAKAAKQ